MPPVGAREVHDVPDRHAAFRPERRLHNQDPRGGPVSTLAVSPSRDHPWRVFYCPFFLDTDMTPHPDLTSPGPLIPAHRHHAWLLEARELLRLAVPLAATQLAQMAILATDTIMLGHYSKEALAAGALGNTVFFLIWLVGCGIPMAVSPVIAHIQGEHSGGKPDRDRREVRIAVRMGLWSVAITSLPLMAFLFFTQPILLFFGQQPLLAADAAIFVSALAIGLPFALGFQVLRSFSTALSHAVPPMVVLGLAIPTGCH